jgi:O-antigen ligase
MVLCLGGGDGGARPRWKRALRLVAIATTAAGLWFSESRTALAALGVTAAVAAAWIASSTWQPKWRLAAFASVVVLALAAGALRASLLERDPTYRGAGFRTGIQRASLRMVAARPLFGVEWPALPISRGCFSVLSWHGVGAENAHNYFCR